MHEVLSRAAQRIYLQQIGNMELSSKQYHADSYYENLVDGQLVRVFEQRPPLDQFFRQLIDAAANSNQTYIVHEHASLISEYWIEELLQYCAKSVYLVRDRKEQLASRLIAGYTGVYMIKDDYMLCHGDYSCQDQYLSEKFTKSIATREQVEQLVHLYTCTDRIMSDLGVVTVSYESVHHPDSDIKKLFVSSYARLCEQDQQLIEDTLLNYDL